MVTKGGDASNPNHRHNSMPNISQTSKLYVGTSHPLERSYFCAHCNKEFSTPQALGGHQTAHRKEMKAMKHKVEVMKQHQCIVSESHDRMVMMRGSERCMEECNYAAYGIHLKKPRAPNFGLWEVD